jgi:transcriptional regulator with XRE-family HTH domain
MWEQARRLPDPEMLIRLAEMFDVSIDWLLGVNKRENYKLEEFLNSLNHDNNVKSAENLTSSQCNDPTQELPEEARLCLEEFKDYMLKKYGIEG